MPQSTVIKAATAGSLDLMRLLHALGLPLDGCANAAAYNKRFKCFVYAAAHGPPVDAATCLAAVKGGSLRCLKHAVEVHGAVPDAECCNTAAILGRLAHLKYLFARGAPFDDYTSDEAAAGGNVACMRFVHENGAPWHDMACSSAFESGPECLLYAIQQGAPLDPYMLADVAAKGYLDCIRAAHARGVPFDDRVMLKAVKYGRADCVRFLLRINAPVPGNITSVAATYKRGAILRTLRSAGVACDAGTIHCAVQADSVDCLLAATDPPASAAPCHPPLPMPPSAICAAFCIDRGVPLQASSLAKKAPPICDYGSCSEAEDAEVTLARCSCAPCTAHRRALARRDPAPGVASDALKLLRATRTIQRAWRAHMYRPSGRAASEAASRFYTSAAAGATA